MAIIQLGKLIGGFAKDYHTTNNSVEAPSNKYSKSNGMSVLRNGFKGYMSPAEITDNGFGTGATLTSLPRASVTDIGLTVPKTYGVTGGLSGTAPQLYEEESSALQAVSSISAHGGHNFTTLPNFGIQFWGEDFIIYSHNVSSAITRSGFYSWNDNTDGDIGKLVLSTSTGVIGSQDDDWMSTVAAQSGGTALTTNVPHKMVEGSDLVLYITNGQYLAAYDGNTGANGTINYTALNLGAGWMANSVRRYGNYVAVSCVKANLYQTAFNYISENKVVLWDGFSPDPNFVYQINDGVLTSIASIEGNLYAFSKGKNNTTKIWVLNGSKFDLLDEQLSSQVGAPPTHEQIDYFDGDIYWASGDAPNASTSNIICCYSPLGSNQAGIHIPFLANDGTNDATTIGFLKNTNQGVLRIGGKFSTSYKLQDNGNGNYYINTQTYTRLFTLPYKANIKKFTIFFAQFGTGASVSLGLVKDFNTCTGPGATNDLLNVTLTNANLGAVSSYKWNQFIPDVSSFYMIIKFDHASVSNTAAIIRDIWIEVEPTDKP